MVFSSVVFIFYFLPVFLIVYYLTGARNAVLLTGSAIFYVWGGRPISIPANRPAAHQLLGWKADRLLGRSQT